LVPSQYDIFIRIKPRMSAVVDTVNALADRVGLQEVLQQVDALMRTPARLNDEALLRLCQCLQALRVSHTTLGQSTLGNTLRLRQADHTLN
jgi:hypothetical protein